MEESELVVEAEVVQSCETGESSESTSAKESPTRSRAWESRLFGLMAKGLSLREACRQEGMPHFSTVYDHAAQDQAFASRLAEARKACASAQQDELDELMSQARTVSPMEVQGLRLAADILKFKLVKVLPKLYGDQPAQVNIDNRTVTVVLSDEKRLELQERLARLQLSNDSERDSKGD